MSDARFDGFGTRHGLCLAAATWVGLAVAGSACGGTDNRAAVRTASARDEGVQHESCEGARIEQLDTNGDGKPDIQRVLDGKGQEICRTVDLNHDGKPDLYEYFDSGGTVRRREFCYDDTGTVNAIESYDAGKLVKREYDIDGRHRIDTWDWFDPSAPINAKTGRPVHPSRRERDTNGDGHVDQWWTWNGDKLTIAVDRKGVGKPDLATTVVLGANGGPVAPESASAATAQGPVSSDAGAVTGDGGNP